MLTSWCAQLPEFTYVLLLKYIRVFSSVGNHELGAMAATLEYTLLHGRDLEAVRRPAVSKDEDRHVERSRAMKWLGVFSLLAVVVLAAVVYAGQPSTGTMSNLSELEIPLSAKAEGECEENYGFLPCSTSIGGNLFLMLVYGFLLLVAAKMISDGSEGLLQVLNPGIIGGLVLPILGSFPDALLIVVSGVGGTLAEAQEQVLVGMGVLAGSTIMLLTLAWAGSLICGRCDLDGPEGTAKDRTLTKGWSLTKTGVTTDEQTRMGAWIMIASVVPYLIIQIPLIDNGSEKQARTAALVGLIVCLVALVAYCTYQVMSPWLQQKRIGFAKLNLLRTEALRDLQRLSLDKSWGGLLLEDGVTPNPETLTKIFRQFDENGDGQLSKAELKALIIGLGIKQQGAVPTDEEVNTWLHDFDRNTDGCIELAEFIKGLGLWIVSVRKLHMKQAAEKAGLTHKERADDGVLEHMSKKARNELAILEEAEQEEEDEDEKGSKPKTKNQIIRDACLLMFGGAVIVSVFADPMVDSITNFSTASGIPSFFVAFVVSPLASNASELVSSLLFAMKKKKKTISLTYSQVYGAITMNNTLCLGVFLILVYVRGIVWVFSAEVTVILVAVAVVGIIGGSRKTFPLWMGWLVLAVYPFSIALVAFLDYVVGWQ
eukprot:jgi/Mesen1/5446/ME000271S04468